jgi:nucleotide-binding universal stress UspA family protein
MTRQSSIVVGVDDSPGAALAIGWAVREAASRHAAVRLICVYGSTLRYAVLPLTAVLSTDDHTQQRHIAEAVIARATAAVTALDPDVEVGASAIYGDPSRVLIEESAGAAVLVLGTEKLGVLGAVLLGSVSTTVSARGECPVVVVSDGGLGSSTEVPAVVVGVDGSDRAAEVLAFAFDYANAHRLPVRAIFCWHLDFLGVMSWNADHDLPERARQWLTLALVPWQAKYPDVPIESHVVEDSTVGALVTASMGQELLVVGTHGRHALPGSMLGSVSQGVLHHAHCSVALVATGKPDHDD